jgi:hypothetical protein
MNLIKFSFLLNNLQFMAALGGALGIAAGVINAVGLVVVFAGLIGTAVSALGERNVAGIKTSLAISAVGGCAWLLAQAMFAAGGAAPNVTMQAIQGVYVF